MLTKNEAIQSLWDLANNAETHDLIATAELQVKKLDAIYNFDMDTYEDLMKTLAAQSVEAYRYARKDHFRW